MIFRFGCVCEHVWFSLFKISIALGKWTCTQEGLDYKYDHFIIENNGARNKTGKDKKMQGILALVDSREQDGGFCCVPGFHRHLSEWSKATRACDWARKFNSRFDFVPVPPNHLVCIVL